MKIPLILIWFLCLGSAAWAESAVFDYDDFGPQVLAHEVIGFQWYQWNATGGPDPNKMDRIRVVVYWNEPLASVKEKYPVNRTEKKDYRYLSYEEAMAYLDSSLSKLPDAAHLVETRKTLRLLKED